MHKTGRKVCSLPEGFLQAGLGPQDTSAQVPNLLCPPPFNSEHPRSRAVFLIGHIPHLIQENEFFKAALYQEHMSWGLSLQLRQGTFPALA